MKIGKYLVFTLGLSLMVFLVNSQNVNIKFNQDDRLSLKNNESYFDNDRYIFSLSQISGNTVVRRNQMFVELSIPDGVNDGKIGFPSLPTIKKLIEIPLDAEPEVYIHSYDVEEIRLNDLALVYPVLPQQPSLRKDQDPDAVPFYKNNDAYNANDYIETPLVQVQISGIARMKQIGRLIISPVQYNPYNNSIKVFKNIEFTVYYKNANFSKTLALEKKYYSPLFHQQLKKTLLTVKQNLLKDQLTQYPISYLIISDRMFEMVLEPFVNWKIRQGYKVTVAYTDVIGTTTTAIKSYITSVYQSSTPQNPAPTFLLLVGDIAQVPTFTGTAGNHPTDTYYATMDGASDKIPDMYVGRMSANTPQQLSNIINKTMEYEQFTMPDPAYLQYALMIAGVDATFAPTYGNGQINYGNQYYTNTSNNIISHTYLYGSGSAIVSNSPQAAPAIKQNISDGIGFANYTAHCSSSGWSDPSVSTSDVPNFTNEHKYGLWIGNCCQSCRFNDPECFGEAVLRAANKGAVAYIGASNNSFWIEDYYYSVGVKSVSANPSYDPNSLGFFDRLFHLFNEPPSEWYVTAAQINYAGNLAVEQNGTSTTYYWEMYHLMGDPSLMPYLGIPATLYANYPNSLPIGVSTITVQTEPYAYVGLSLNNVWIDAKYTGSGSSVVLDISSITIPCTLDIVITKQNKQPHVGTIQLVPNNAPYVVYTSYVAIDTGVAQNGNVEYSESVDLNVTLTNVGLQNAYDVQATLTTNNPHVQITNNTAYFGDIMASSSSYVNNAFSFVVDPLINDQETVVFTIHASDNQSNLWTSTFNIVLHAPILQATTVTIDDQSGNNNGRLDPGETATIKILTKNIGHAISPQAYGSISTSSSYVSLVNNVDTLGQIQTNAPVYAEFVVNIEASTPMGTAVPFVYTADANGYTTTKNFTLTVGLIVEDFETNNFTQFPWDTINYGDAPWIIISGNSIYEGNYSARSGVIPHGTWFNNSKSDLKITIVVLSPDTLSFYKRVSSEENYDFLQFFVDNNKLGEWSGEVPWSRSAYYLNVGTHSLLWRYTKDYSISQGEDAAFIDFIVFPPVDLISNKPFVSNDILQMMVYPNPFTDEFTLLCNVSKSSTCQLVLYDQLGKIMWQLSSYLQEGTNVLPVTLSNLPCGIYHFNVITNNQNTSLKITKIK